MQLLKQYTILQKQIHDYFGYVEDWAVIPMDDCTDLYWKIIDGEAHGGKVQYAVDPKEFPTDETEDEDLGEYWEVEIYTQRHLPKWVYRGAEYTMICVDTHTDCNRLLQIFDNSKELK